MSTVSTAGMEKELKKIVGRVNFIDDPETLLSHPMDHSLIAGQAPNYIVRPGDAGQVQAIVKLANEHKIPVVPCSSGIHFNGNVIPHQGGILLDLTRMNRILDVDMDNKMVRIEPGVTWGQLQAELACRNMMALSPLLPHPLKSVLSCHLEREPMLIPKYEYAGPLLTMEAVLPNGDLFRTGSACVPGFPDKSLAEGVNPGGPGYLSYTWLLQGAQGTMGVATWGKIKMAPRPSVDKTFLIPFERLEEAVQLVYNILRRMIGTECLILNNNDLAAILSAQYARDYDCLRKTLPAWMVILVSGGGWRRPEEKIEYEEQGLREAAAELHIPGQPTALPGFPGLERELPSMLRSAWPQGATYWKFAPKGGCQDLFFQSLIF